MEYQVIGWTDHEEDYFENGLLKSGDEKYNAIVKEIREHQYVIYGDEHQENSACVPVLNDGKKYLFTQRGWGKVMADAYGLKGDYDYARFLCFSGFEPKGKHPAEMKVPSETPKTHFMHLADEPFLQIKSGEKSIELRLNDEKRKAMRKYDTIYFTRVGDDREEWELLVDGDDASYIYASLLHKYAFASFAELFENDWMKENAGFGDQSVEECVEQMRKYYTKEEEEKYGVVALEFLL